VLELRQAVLRVERGVELCAGKAIYVAQAVSVEREQDNVIRHLPIGFFEAFFQDRERRLAGAADADR